VYGLKKARKLHLQNKPHQGDKNCRQQIPHFDFFFPVLVYQGSITLLASVLKPLLVPAVVAQMSGVGGLLILGIGMNMLREKKIKVGNLLPAIFIPLVWFIVHGLYTRFL